MSRPIIYRSRQRWLVGAAFVFSALIHIGAVLAARSKPVTETFADSGNRIVDVTFYPADPLPAEPPPPDIPEAVPPVIEQNDFPEEQSSPVPKPNVKRQTRPLKLTSPGLTGPTRMSSAKIAALNAPRPGYPYEARQRHITGSGVAVLTVDRATGYVTNVSMRQSTGSPILDGATVNAFKCWRFKPETVSEVLTPITFTLVGAQY